MGRRGCGQEGSWCVRAQTTAGWGEGFTACDGGSKEDVVNVTVIQSLVPGRWILDPAWGLTQALGGEVWYLVSPSRNRARSGMCPQWTSPLPPQQTGVKGRSGGPGWQDKGIPAS